MVLFTLEAGQLTPGQPFARWLTGPIPTVVEAAEGVTASLVERRLVSGRKIRVISIHLGGGESLEWTAWPSGVPPPERVDEGGLRMLSFYGKRTLMPRKMWCYGRAYPFSRQTVPQEAVTPPEITNLFSATTDIFKLDYEMNMCLVNDYGSGREAISRHSDDEGISPEGQFPDVICWLDGPAERTMVLREVDGPKVLEIKMGRGIYAMRGRQFQTRFTHEIPELYPALFKKMAPLAPEGNVIEVSRWLVDHPQEVRRTLGVKDRERYNEWRLWRTSYTLRLFV